MQNTSCAHAALGAGQSAAAPTITLQPTQQLHSVKSVTPPTNANGQRNAAPLRPQTAVPEEKKQPQKRDDTPSNGALKSLALQYFCDPRGRGMSKLCKEVKKEKMYDALKKFVSRDNVLNEVHNEMKAGDFRHRSNAIQRINELIPQQVDLSTIGKPEIDVNCCGMCCPEVTNYADIDPAFCLQHWNCADGVWHAKMCHHRTHLDPKSAVLMGWKHASGSDDIQCPSCYSAKKNALSRYGAQLRKPSKTPPVLSMLKGQVKRICSEQFERVPRGVAISTLKSDTELNQTMQMLAAGGVTEVIYNGDTSVRTCMEGGCSEIIITRYQSNNAVFCPCCTRKKESELRSECRRAENWDQQVAANSCTPHIYLTEPQLRERLANVQKDRVKWRREAKDLRKQLTDTEIELSEAKTKASQGFLMDGKLMIDELLKDTKSLRQNLKLFLCGAMDGLVEKDKHQKKDVEIDHEAKEQMVDVIVEQMLNTSLKLNGKPKQVRFSPVIFQVAQAVWSTSNSAYKELVTLMPACFPSIRHLQQNKTDTYISDGRTSMPYQQRKAARNARGKLKEVGYLQCDEMHLKHGVVYLMTVSPALKGRCAGRRPETRRGPLPGVKTTRRRGD